MSPSEPVLAVGVVLGGPFAALDAQLAVNKAVAIRTCCMVRAYGGAISICSNVR
jgi:hypothetical protein